MSEPSGSPIFVDYQAIPPQPWRNGRGITRSLFDDADPQGRWRWRISIAEITGTQPYSAYPGIRRAQVALGPGGVDLTINDRTVRLEPEAIVVFEGEDDVAATPTEVGFLDLNVMTRRDACSAQVEIIQGPVVAAVEGETVILVALDDRCTIDGRGRHRCDAAMLTRAGSAKLTGRHVLVRLRPLSI